MVRTRTQEPVEASDFFRHHPLPLIRLGSGGRIEAANPPASRLLSRPPELLRDTPIGRWVLPADLDALVGVIRAGQAGSPRDTVLRFRSARGRTEVRRVRAVRSEGPTGTCALLLLRELDPVERETAEDTRVRAFLEELPRHFLVLLGPDRRIRRASGVGDIHLVAPGHLTGEVYTVLVRDEAASLERAEAMVESLWKGEVWRGLQWHRRADGEDVPVRICAAPDRSPETGAIVGAYVSGLDVQQNRRDRDRADHAEMLAGIGKVTVSVADRLRRDLEALTGALATARRGEAAGEILSALEVAEEMGGYVEALAELGSSSGGRRGRLSLPDLVREALQRRRPRLVETGVELEVVNPPDFPTLVGAPGEVTRVLDIVLDDLLVAADRDAGGDRLLRVELTTDQERAGVVFTDSASVVSEPELEAMFEPRFSSREGHAGLGLAMGRALAGRSGGRLWARNDEAGRTSLVLDFPRDPDGAVAGLPARVERSERRVLVVDDEVSVRNALRKFLEKAGYQVLEAWSGRSAMARITGGRLPDLIITDLKMLDGSGYWLLDELSEYFPQLLLRTVIVTGDPEQTRGAELARRTGCPLVRKPFELPALLEVIDGLVIGD